MTVDHFDASQCLAHDLDAWWPGRGTLTTVVARFAYSEDRQGQLFHGQDQGRTGRLLRRGGMQCCHLHLPTRVPGIDQPLGSGP